MRVLSILVLLCPLLARSVEPLVLPLWPDKPPGETAALPPEADTTKASDRQVAGRPVVRIGNVSQPTWTVYRPDPAKNTGTAVLVCPGGGYSILATDIEGTEICAWLNAIGVTGVLLKYRVPVRPERARHDAPLQDAQRALGLVRHHATEWQVNPERIGVLGFSAGGHLAAVLSNQHAERTYPAVDAADAVSCRPDFTVLVYPAYLVNREQGDTLSPEVLPAAERTPPTFLVMTQDDPVRVENALGYYQALHQARVPAELHVYPTGGHGYGRRATGDPVAQWPELARAWLAANGWLQPAR